MTTPTLSGSTNPPVVPGEFSADLSKLPKKDRENVLDRLKTRKREKALAAWVDEQYRACQQARIEQEQKWHLHYAFYMGKQNLRLITTTATANGFALTPTKAPPWRVKMVVNKIRPIIRHEIARLASQAPTPVVVPATTEDEDQAAARVSEQLLVTYFNSPEFRKIRRSWIWWGSVCGKSYLKTYWDATAVDGYSKAQGMIQVERVTPFHILVPDLLEEDIEKQAYVIHTMLRTPEFVKAVYGKEVTPDATQARDTLHAAFLNLNDASDKSKMKDNVIVKEMWIKPGSSPLMPNGGLVIVANGDVLYLKDDGLPYEHGEYPFSPFDGIPTGQFYGESSIADLIPLQKNYNRTKSQIIEAKNMTSKPQMLAQAGSVDARKITSEPGQVIYYTPGYDKPTPLPPQTLPNYVLEELDRTQMEIDDVSGQHEITRGSTPGQVTAATAIAYLQEQDDTKLAYQVSSVEDAIAKVGRQYLKLAAQYWDQPRLVRLVGKDNDFEATMWQGNSFKGNTDVRVEAGSALPQSKAARMAFVMDLLKMGMLPPDSGLQLLDIGGIEKVYEDYLVDKRQAQRENLKMSKLPYDMITLVAAQEAAAGMEEDPNALIPVNSYDNHEAHIAEHNRFRKTQQFETLPDEIKAEFEKHVTAHMVALQTGYVSPVGPLGMPMGLPNGPAGPAGPPMMGPPTDPAQGVPNG